MQNQQKTVDELKKKLELAGQEYDKTSKTTQNWQTSMNNAKAELVTMNSQLDKTDQYLEEAKKSTDSCASSIDKYGKQVKEAGDKSGEFGDKSKEAINAVATVLATAGIAAGIKEIANVLGDCTEKAKEFGTEVAKVSTVADTSKTSINTLKEQMLETSNDLGIAAGNISEATYNAISASVETENAVKFAGDSTKLAIGGFTDATTAVDILTTAVNAYNLETEKSTEISDMLVTTQNLGKTTVGELASNMGKVIPLASAYNVQMNNLSTSYAALTANGIATAESTTYLKSMFNELGDTGSAVGKTLMTETGKSFATLMSTGSSLGDVIDILGKSVDGDKTKFNALWSSSEAGIGALSLLGTGADGFNAILDKMNNSAGATDTAFEKMADTTEMAENKFNNAIDNMEIAIGDQLNPALEDMYDTGTDAISWATDFVNDNPEFVQAVAAITVGVGALAIGIGGATAAMLVFNAVMNANPIMLFVSATAAATAALITFTALNNESKKAVEKVNEKYAETNDRLKENIQARKDSEEENDAEILTLQGLRDTIGELNDRESLNTSEKAHMLSAVMQLNEAMPELNLQIDENTGKIIGNTEELEKNIDAQLKSYEVQFMQEDLKDIAQERYDAEKNLTELTQEREEKQNKLNEVEAEYAGWLEKIDDNVRAMSMQYADEAIQVQQEYSDKINASKDAIAEIDAQMRESREAIATATEDFENMSLALDGAKESTEGLSETSIEYKDTLYNDVAPEVVSSISSIQTAYEESKAAALDSLQSQVALFDELSVKSDLSASQMATNLQSQTDTFNQYKDGIFMGCTITHLGSNKIHITSGRGFYKGRDFIIPEQDMNVALSSSGTQLGRLYVHIDLSDSVNPIQLLSVTGITLPALVNDEDFNAELGEGDLELATYNATELLISNLKETFTYITSANQQINQSLNNGNIQFQVVAGKLQFRYDTEV